MLIAENMRDVLCNAVSTGRFPENAAALSNALKTYIQTNGQPQGPTISYNLAPCNGLGFEALISKASSKGVADDIISTGIAAELSGSTKVIPASHGVQTVPMSFDHSAKVSNLSQLKDYREVWLEISKAIIKFLKPEIV